MGGQVNKNLIADEVIRAKENFNLWKTDLINSISRNTRFPEAQVTRLNEMLKIEASIWKSGAGLEQRFIVIDDVLRRMARQADLDSRPASGLPREDQRASRRMMRDMQDSIVRLAVTPELQLRNQGNAESPVDLRGITQEQVDAVIAILQQQPTGGGDGP